MAELDVNLVLPGHEECFTNHRERAMHLKHHHEKRLTEIVRKLKVESLTSYMLASKIHWDINYNYWDDFPPFQKYLALGETIVHLNLLEQKEIVQKTHINKTIMYNLQKC